MKKKTTVFAKPEDTDSSTISKRLARIDMHTLLDGEFAKVKALSVSELVKVLNTSYTSDTLKQAATHQLRSLLSRVSQSERDRVANQIKDESISEIVRKPIDPEDQDVVSV